jgi:hypothetical protein
MNRRQLADTIDEIEGQIRDLNSSKADNYKSYREELEATGMAGVRISAEISATKAAIAKRRKIRENPDQTAERDDLIDEILVEISSKPHVHARDAA